MRWISQMLEIDTWCCLDYFLALWDMVVFSRIQWGAMTWWKWLLVHLIYPMKLFWFLGDTKLTEVCSFCGCCFPALSIEILSLLTLAVIRRLCLVVYWCHVTCIWNKDINLKGINVFIIAVYAYMFLFFVKVNIQNANHAWAKAPIFNCE